MIHFLHSNIASFAIQTNNIVNPKARHRILCAYPIGFICRRTVEVHASCAFVLYICIFHSLRFAKKRIHYFAGAILKFPC